MNPPQPPQQPWQQPQQMPPQAYGPPQQPPPYGYGPPPQPPYAYPQPPPWASKYNGFGIAGLVCGIIAVVMPIVSATAVMFVGLVAIILSGVGLTKAKIGTANNRGMSRFGMALGLIALLGGFVLSAIYKV